MKQHTAAPQTPTVAYARARVAICMVIDGFASATGGSKTATNLTTRRLGMRPT